MNIKAFTKQVQYTATLYCLLLLTYFLYSPGINSGYYLDDPSNLSSLSNITKYSFEQIGLFSLSGFSGPTGRPLSLLTFALQFPDWPGNPAAFKYVNLSIHLINTIFVFIISKQLFRSSAQTRTKSHELALIVATFWAIHPIQVSTVLYCIQRMTELSASFVLFGIAAYLHGRNLLTNIYRFKVAYIWMTLGLFFGVLLSILSKENGILIFLFVLLIEKTLFHSSQDLPYLKKWQMVFLYLPIIIVFSYLFYKFDAEGSYRYRSFTLAERLLTENAVIFDYLRKIVMPTVNSFSLYYDDFSVSQKITASYQTLFGFLLIVSSIIFSIFFRKKYPLICFGILWYYAGHILESSFIALELYFEHRNYLPLVGIAFAITALFYKIMTLVNSKAISSMLYILALLYLSHLVFITLEQTALWGKQQSKIIWALEKPNSKRAQSAAANLMASIGNYDQALKFTQNIMSISPNDPSPYIAWLQYLCYTDSIDTPDMIRLYDLAERGKVNLASIFILNNIILDMVDGGCKNLSYGDLKQLFMHLESNKSLIKKADFYQIYAMMEGNHGHYLKALNLANRSLTYKSNVRVALFQLRWFALLGDYQAAYNYLDKVREINQSHPKMSILYLSTIKEWESFLLTQLSNNS